MRIIVICILACLSDLILGDPARLYHPVRGIGFLIMKLEKLLYKGAGEAWCCAYSHGTAEG